MAHSSREIRAMFGSIAGRYDLLNHLLSGNLDRRWRRAAVRELPERPTRILDLCGGTGDLSLEIVRARPDGVVVCCDFAHPMLVRAQDKFRRRGADRCLTLEADGLRMPFPDGSFDAASVAFGVRNFADLGAGLREIHRVLASGGRLVVLEFSQPTAPVLAAGYRFYLKRVLPRLGNGIAAGTTTAYGYLARSIAAFDRPETLAGRIREAGFAACGWTLRSGGVVAVHTAFKD